MSTSGQTFEVIRDTVLHTVDGQTIQIRKNDLLEFLGNHNFQGYYQSDPIPEDHFRLLGGSQSADVDHPNYGVEGVLSADACNHGVAKPSYLVAYHA